MALVEEGGRLIVDMHSKGRGPFGFIGGSRESREWTLLVRPGTPLTERLVRHELAHVTQWNRHPVTFPFRYIGAHIRHGYQDNPYEREARAAEAGRAPEAGGAE